MAAPKKNEFWKKRTKHGRNHIYEDPEELWKDCCSYFKWVEKNPLYEAKHVVIDKESTIEYLPKMRAMTMTGLYLHLGIDQQTWANYKEREDFLGTISLVEGVITEQKFTGAAAGLLNPSFIGKALGLVDKQETDHKSSDGSMTPSRPTLTEDQAKQLLAEMRNGKG